MRRLLLALLTVAVVTPLAAQSPVIPTDTAVHVGVLANGFRYFVRHNATPANRLELRLVVRAGSILEDADQRGLAHFVEHMAFNGTTHFAKNDLIQYLESIGVRFGADLNASTSFDETVYILPVPSDKPELVDRAFDILQDWAAGVTFDSTEVVNERGVVMGEWRSGLGVGSRLRDREFPLLFAGSRYADRLPIGDTAIIAHAEPGPIKRFYHDWYRPDLMAVIAVGDVPAERLEALIKDRFGGLVNPASPRPRVDAPVPEVPGTRLSVVTDPELTSESIQLLVRRPNLPPYHTEADERRVLVNALVSGIAGQRLSDLARKPEAPFVNAFFGPSRLVRNIEVFALSVTAKEGRSLEAFEAALTERRRLDAHGVLPAELERAKASLLRAREQAAAEEQKQFSAGHVNQLLEAYLTGNSFTTSGTRFTLARRLLPAITLEEVNAAIRGGARGSDRFIAVRAPERAGLVLPTRAQLLAVLDRTDTATVAAWTETVIAGPLVVQPPTPGRVVSTRLYPAIGVTEWRLSNGVHVLVKSTDFKADQILIGASAPGGLSLLPDADLLNGMMATTIVQQSGFGQFDQPALRRRLAGKVAVAFPVISETTQEIGGLTAPADLETFFELLYLVATAPRLDTAAVAAFRSQGRTALANRDRQPGTALSDTIMVTMGGNSPRAQPLTLARFETLDPQRAFEIYRERFSDFSNFTFTIVGNVNLDSLKPLVERWVGGLPAKGRKERWIDRKVRPPEGQVTKVVRKGKEPVSRQVVFFTGSTDATNAAAALAGDAAAQILETRLLERLREAMGATYSVNVSTNLTAIPRKQYQTVISFTATPAQADTLWSAAWEVITSLRSEGPTADELQKFVEQTRRSTEVDTKTNFWWAGMLGDHTESGEPFDDIVAWNARLGALSVDMVRDAARQYLDPTRLARFILLPETTATP
ncbi:MAG: insulinase family protein [Gemmatimonadota bacterium]